MKRLSCLVLFGAMLFPALALAGELKIIDSQGLVRALARIEQPVGVAIAFSPQAAEQPPRMTLQRVDGISRELEGRLDQPGSYLFSEVPDGTWRIYLPEGEVEVRQVKIVRYTNGQ